MAPRSKVDRLTDRERALVKARLEHPDWALARIAKLAGYAGNRPTLQESANAAFKRPEVRLALLHPRPEKPVQPFDMDDLPAAKKRLVQWLVEIIEDKEMVGHADRIRCIAELATYIPNVKVPVGVDHRMLFNMEKFVELAGGKPEGEQVHEVMPN